MPCGPENKGRKSVTRPLLPARWRRCAQGSRTGPQSSLGRASRRTTPRVRPLTGPEASLSMPGASRGYIIDSAKRADELGRTTSPLHSCRSKASFEAPQDRGC